MDFDLADVQAAWQHKGATLGREVARDALRLRAGRPERQPRDATAAGVVMDAARVGLMR